MKPSGSSAAGRRDRGPGLAAAGLAGTPEHYVALPAVVKAADAPGTQRGPTAWSNWVMPGCVLAGAYPASIDDAETDRLLTTLLGLGVNTFVCLQAEVSLNTPETVWRAGRGLRPYIKDAQRILSRAHETRDPKITQQKIDFLHLPIIDGSVTTDQAMHRLAEDCCDRVLKGEVLYIHCWGGHGRTGTLVGVMLSRLYSLPCSEALRLCQAYHDSRVYPQGVRSPQTAVQRAQVRRLCTTPSFVHSIQVNILKATPITKRQTSGRSALRPNVTPTDGASPRMSYGRSRTAMESASSPRGTGAVGGRGLRNTRSSADVDRITRNMRGLSTAGNTGYTTGRSSSNRLTGAVYV